MKIDTKRRTFLASGVATGAGLTILPGCKSVENGVVTKNERSTEKLNLAVIGAHGRASQHYGQLKSQNIVALCDVNAEKLALANKEFPKAKQYTDWRKCLEQPDIDGVVICTPDHHHAFISIWAMNRGLHVYCEKPLGDCVHEARAVREVYLKNKNKVATQHGTQRHALPNFDRVREMVQGGAIGDLKDVHVWGCRRHDKTAYLPAAGPAPSSIDWEQWIGPVQMHPYNPEYFVESRGPGSGCLSWNMYDDFGSWQVGDMGSHTMDLAWNTIDAAAPTKVKSSGDDFIDGICPSALTSIFTVPANGWRDEIRLVWYQGGPMPKSPNNYVDLTKIGHGAMFKGSKGVLIADFNNRMLLPLGKDTDMTYYRPPAKGEAAPPVGNFQQEWFNACRGDLKTSCDFDYSGVMIETLMLGLVAHRVGKELDYDSATGTVTNDQNANEYLTKKYRKGWVLNG